MTQETPSQPERPRYEHHDRHEKDEKGEEKRGEKGEKSRGEKSWDEKWRRDPINAIGWAAIFIWAGLCVLAETTNWGPSTFPWWKTWALILAGAGAIFILGALIRLTMPEHRRPITGRLIFGFILLGVGLQDLTHWHSGALGAFILIAIGVIIILAGVFRRHR
jgi:energy-converting hydrogenase Eha subunit E